MYATLKLLNSYFWKTVYGPILAFVFPIVLLAILGNILRLEYVYPGLIALSMLFLGLIALPLAIMELKGSSLFKYIGSSPVNPLKFTLVVIGFYAFIAICTGFVIFFATMAIFPTKTFPSSGFSHGVLGGLFTVKGAFSFYFGCLIHLMLVIMSGLVISTFAKTPQQALTLGLMITLPSMFLSGMVLSVDVIAESPVMNWISRFIPYRYSTGNIVVAATPIDQLGSALNYWLHQRFDSKQALDYITSGSTGAPNNMLDNLVWPYKDMTTATIGAGGTAYILQHYPQFHNDVNQLNTFLQSLPHGGLGYEAFVASGFDWNIFTFSAKTKSTDNTLYNLLVNKWDIMQISSDNNIFNWMENWGVRKIPSTDALTDFVTKYFRGVDEYGNVLPPSASASGTPAKVQKIWEQIQAGNFSWLEMFTHQSNILYYQADRVLNTLLPLTLSGLGAWYTFKNFNWAAR